MPGFRFNLQAIGFGVVICDLEMRHQWNIPSKLVDLLDDRLNSIDLGYTRSFIWRCHPGWRDGCAPTTPNIQLYPGA